MFEDDTTSWLNVLSMFYGGALGDSLGVPFEFRWSRPISEYTGRLEYRPFMKSKYQGTRYGVVGQVSDDTEMSVALARSIVNNDGKYDQSKAVLSYIDWANSKPFGMGRNTRALFYGIKPNASTAFKTYKNRYKKRFNTKLKGGISPKDAQSNGSLMRCSALALSPGKDYRNVIDDVYLTNPNVINKECGVIYVKILRQLLFGDLGIDPLESAKQKPVIQAIEEAKSKKIKDVTKAKGWVVNAFYCAIYCLLNFEDYVDAINWVIKLGGDTDTNAAIAGCLMGAKIGYPFLIDQRIEPNLTIMLNANTSKGEFPRPERYLPSSYIEISEKFTTTTSQIRLENENYKDLLYYFKQDQTPFLYTQISNTTFKAHLFLNLRQVVILDVMREVGGNYIVDGITIKPMKNLLQVLKSIEKKPMNMQIFFSGTPTQSFPAYRFLTKFSEALIERALDTMHSEVTIVDIDNEYYNLLYGRDFFIINN